MNILEPMSISILQSESAAREHLDAILRAEGFGSPGFPRNVAQILDELLASAKKVDAILVDISGDSGLLACRQIRASLALAQVPLFAVFDESSVAKIQAAFEAGVTDCIGQSVHPTELSARLRRAMTRQHQKDPGLLAEKGEPESGEPATDSAPNDPLTQLANVQLFQENLEHAWRRDRRSQSPLSVMVLNIDHLASYNRHYGRAAGDDCLRRIAALLQDSLYRPDDAVAHRGAGEFVVILSRTDRQGAVIVGERLLNRVQELAIPHDASSAGTYVSVSIGIASVTPSDDLSADDLVLAAGRALSQAKIGGRKRLMVEEDVALPWLA